MMMLTPQTQTFERERPRLVALGYQMLGSVADAEDAVQDAWLRFRRVRFDSLASPGAWLTTIVTRLCLDRLRQRKVRQLTYVGPWLPEPLADDGPAVAHEVLDGVTFGFLFALESLTPLERGVLILKEGFDFTHEEIAGVFNIRMAHSRQLLRRARSRIAASDAATNDTGSARPILEAFLTSAQAGDPAGLVELLAEDVIAWSDGGGKVSAALVPLEGIDRVNTVFSHLLRNRPDDIAFSIERFNGDVALVARQGWSTYFVTLLAVSGQRVRRIYTIRNPQKLGRVNPPPVVQH